MRSAAALGEEGIQLELERKLRREVDKQVWDALVEDGFVEDVLLTDKREAWDDLIDRCRTYQRRHARARSSSTRRRPVSPGIHPESASTAILFKTQAEAYARSVESERGVVEYRRDYLGNKSLAPEAVPSFLQRHLIAWAKTPIDPYDSALAIHLNTIGMTSRAIPPIGEGYLLVAKTAEWPDRPGAGAPEEWSYDRTQEEDFLWVYSVRLVEGTARSLHRLWMLGQLLARDYPWHPAQLTAFVLTGEVPTVPAIRFRSWRGWGRSRDLPQAHRLILDVDATLTAKAVSRFFLELQAEMGVVPRRRMTERRASLGRFHMEHMHEGRWRDRMNAWNNAHPQWKYNDERNFRRDGLAAFKQINSPPKMR